MIMLYDTLLLASEQLLSILIFHFIIFIFILFDDRMDAQYEGIMRIILEHGDDADAKTNVRKMIMMMMMMTIIIVVTIVVIIIVIDDEDRD